MSTLPKPDFTAWFVLQGTIAAMHHPSLRDASNNAALALYKPLSDAASKTRLMSRLIHALPYSWQYRIGDLVTNPGRLRHFYFRKKEIEKQVRSLLSGGIEQVVVLGAGLDILSLRLAPEYRAVKFIEIDTGSSQQFKISAQREGGVNLPGNVEYIEGDLRHPLSDILAKSTLYKGSAKTLWIAEGFFMFIPEEGVVRILREIKQLSVGGSHLIFTSLPTIKQSTTFGHTLQKLYLPTENCSFNWALPFDKMPSFIENIGYRLVHQIEYGALHKGYMGQEFKINHAIGENIHIAIV